MLDPQFECITTPSSKVSCALSPIGPGPRSIERSSRINNALCCYSKGKRVAWKHNCEIIALISNKFLYSSGGENISHTHTNTHKTLLVPHILRYEANLTPLLLLLSLLVLRHLCAQARKERESLPIASDPLIHTSIVIIDDLFSPGKSRPLSSPLLPLQESMRGEHV